MSADPFMQGIVVGVGISVIAALFILLGVTIGIAGGDAR